MPNSSFEDYNWCPNSTDGFYLDACKYWNSPSLGSPDYFNACSSEYDITLQRFLFSVPENYVGYQEAHTGTAYSFFTFGQNDKNSLTYSENIQIKLNQPLNTGKMYEVSFFVHNPVANYCINSVGVFLTQNQLSLNTDEVLPFVPQFLSDPNVFFCDTNTWYEVKGTFIAQGMEEYMVIGVFKTLPELKVTDYDGNFLNGLSAAIYIDDVSLVETDLVIPNVLTANNDGVNDVVFLFNTASMLEVDIVNRWGELVNTTDCKSGWNGDDSHGNPLTEGVYFYILKVNGKKQKSGFIELIR